MISRQLRFCVTLSVLLGVWTEEARGQPSIQLVPQHPQIQGSVTLTVTGISGRIRSFIWYKGEDLDNNHRILSYFPGDGSPQVSGPLLDNRMEASPSGSLKISNLNRTDEGKYVIKVQTDNTEVDASVYLKVHEMVGKPTITINASQPKENDTVTLTCNSANAAWITWSRVGAPDAILSTNSTLTLARINRTDKGPYNCMGENLVSKETSDPFKLIVSYGPERPVIQCQKINQSVILLECSADSVPPPQYQWRFNGTDLHASQKILSVVTAPEKEGFYECVVNNSVTQKTARNSFYVNPSSEFVEPPPVNNGPFIGIGIAVLLVVILAAALIYLLFIRKRHKKLKADSTKQSQVVKSSNGQGTAALQEPPETQYADIIIKRGQPKQQPPLETVYANSPSPAHPPPEAVVYSELRIK